MPSKQDDSDLVLFERVDSTAILTMNRPEYRNAQNLALLCALDAAFERALDDDDVKVIVVTGAVEHFSAGHDIGTPDRAVDVQYPRRAALWLTYVGRPGAEERFAREQETYLEMCRRWRDIPKPTIAMVQRTCIAGALMLVWSCDLIVASADAYFSDPVVRMGIPGVEYFADPWELGPRLAKEALFTGGKITAQRGYAVGMVSRIASRDELREATLALCEDIAQMPRFGLTLAKKAVNQAEDLMGLRAGMDASFALHQLGHSHNAETIGHSNGGQSVESIRSTVNNANRSER
jgi:enoyl-CoA hydratase